MIYMANPCGRSAAVRHAMTSKTIGFIDTPRQRNVRPEGVIWCADNGAFSDRWDADKWWRFLQKNAHAASSCLFATLPDVVGDWAATLERSMPWIEPVRSLGYPVAIVLQDGVTAETVPWDDINAVFVGGSTEFKLGEVARELVAEAKRRGLWAHMGRVNSEKRLRYAKEIGCDSSDGTFLRFGPEINMPRVQRWLDRVNGPAVPAPAPIEMEVTQ